MRKTAGRVPRGRGLSGSCPSAGAPRLPLPAFQDLGRGARLRPVFSGSWALAPGLERGLPQPIMCLRAGGAVPRTSIVHCAQLTNGGSRREGAGGMERHPPRRPRGEDVLFARPRRTAGFSCAPGCAVRGRRAPWRPPRPAPHPSALSPPPLKSAL